VVESGSSSQVMMKVRLRRVACGGAPQTNPSAEPIECKVSYSCSGSLCTRTERTISGTPVGTTAIALSGIGSTNVFCFVPSAEADPTRCGPLQEGAGAKPATYIGVNLQVPDPEGPGLLTISDGATLRTAALHLQ